MQVGYICSTVFYDSVIESLIQPVQLKHRFIQVLNSLYERVKQICSLTFYCGVELFLLSKYNLLRINFLFIELN